MVLDPDVAAGGNDDVGSVADGDDLRHLHGLRVDPDEAVRQHDGRRWLLSSGDGEHDRGGSDDKQRDGGKHHALTTVWFEACVGRRDRLCRWQARLIELCVLPQDRPLELLQRPARVEAELHCKHPASLLIRRERLRLAP